MAGETRRRRLRALLDLVGLEGAEHAAIEPAFVHSSLLGQARGGTSSNERLEFLGDAILGYLTAEWLFERHAEAFEGELSRRKAALASDRAIATTARRLGFGDLLRLGKGEQANGGAERESNLGDAFEAFLAVLTQRFGLDVARRFLIEQHLVPLADTFGPDIDAKTALQELTQARFRETPRYHDDGVDGADHERTFRARVTVGDRELGRGQGRSKKAAQQAAAAAAQMQLATEVPSCD